MVTSEFFRGKGSNQSGSFAALVGLGMASFIATFTFTFRTPFDLISGEWLLQLALWCTLLVLLLVVLLSRRAIDPVVRSAQQQKQFITDASHAMARSST